LLILDRTRATPSWNARLGVQKAAGTSIEYEAAAKVSRDSGRSTGQGRAATSILYSIDK